MRAKFLKKQMAKLQKRDSKIYRNFQLQALLWLTAKAFGVRSKWILFSPKALEKYMLFSKKAMEGEADLDRIFNVSYDFGKKLVSFSGLWESEDLAQLVSFLYHYIGITMVGKLPEEFLIKSCYFSNFYGPEECQQMSAMDSGLIAGIYCGQIPKSRLEFVERLTQDCEVCRARFQSL